MLIDNCSDQRKVKSVTCFDQTIDQALQDWKIPGAAVALVKGDQTLHLKGHGFRDLEQGLPPSPSTPVSPSPP